MAVRTIACLPAVVGRLARRRAAGCCSPPRAPSRWTRPPSSGPTSSPPGTRTLNMSQLGRILTDATLDPPVKALFVYNSNPAAVAPEQEQVRARPRARGPVRRRPRAVPDGHRRLRRHRCCRPPRRSSTTTSTRPTATSTSASAGRRSRRSARRCRTPSSSAGSPRAWASTTRACARRDEADGAAGLRLGPPLHGGDHLRAARARGLGAPERARAVRALRARAASRRPRGSASCVSERLARGGARPRGRLRPAARGADERARARAALPARVHLAARPPLPELHLLGAAGLRAARGRAERHDPPRGRRRRAGSPRGPMVRVFNDRGSFLARARVSDAARPRRRGRASRSGGPRCAPAAATPTPSPARS